MRRPAVSYRCDWPRFSDVFVRAHTKLQFQLFGGLPFES